MSVDLNNLKTLPAGQLAVSQSATEQWLLMVVKMYITEHSAFVFPHAVWKSRVILTVSRPCSSNNRPLYVDNSTVDVTGWCRVGGYKAVVGNLYLDRNVWIVKISCTNQNLKTCILTVSSTKSWAVKVLSVWGFTLGKTRNLDLSNFG